MAGIKWTFTVLLQYYEENRYAFELLKNTIELQNNHASIKYILFKHDVLNDKITILNIRQTGATPVLTEEPNPISCPDFFEDPLKYWNPFFKQFVVNHAAEHNFIMTCGHGSGFGFVTRDKLPEDFSFGKKLRTLLLEQRRILSTGIVGYHANKTNENFFGHLQKNQFRFNRFKSIRLKKSGFALVPISALADCISRNFTKPVDFIYTLNCYMQIFESGYALKNIARFYIGTETFSYPTGLDFEKLFSQMSQNTLSGEAHLRTLAHNMTSNYFKKYKDPGLLHILKNNINNFDEESIQDLSLSVNDLDKYSSFRIMLDRLAKHFTTHKTQLYKKIKNVRDKCPDISDNPYGIIDLINFCKKLLNQTQDQTLNNLLIELVNFVTDTTNADCIIVASAFPPNIAGSNNRFIPNGVAVFFPRDKRNFISDQYVKYFMANFYERRDQYLTEFLQESNWDDFVTDYYNHPFALQ